MINNKLIKFSILMLLGKLSFATSPYWYTRYAVGGISYAGGTVYAAAKIASQDKNWLVPKIENFTPNQYGGIESIVTDSSDWSNRSNNEGITGISTDSNGTGFVANGYYLDYLQNGKFVKKANSFPDDIYGISYTGNAVYVITADSSISPYYFSKYSLYKCNPDGTSCNVIDGDFKSFPLGVSFDSNGDGFVVTNDGRLDLYKNDKFVTHVHTFDSYPMSVSYPGGNAVYVSTEWDRSVHKCTDDGTNTNTWHCEVIDTFANYFPAAISFDSNGNGYALSAEGDNITNNSLKVYLNRYEQDKYVDQQNIEYTPYQ